MEKKRRNKDITIGKIIEVPKGQRLRNRVMIGIPMTGLLRAEWVLGRYGQVVPCNWSQVDCIQFLDQYTPLNFLVADGRNIIIKNFMEGNFEWLWFIDHDVILPTYTVLKWNERMLSGDIPVWGGLYFTKSVPSEPLVYRGRGNSFYNKWKIGDQVWVDGMGMGNTIIHRSIIEEMWKDSKSYVVGNVHTRQVFESPAKTWFDPETKSWFNFGGTEDLAWCSRVMDEGYFKKAGWSKYQGKEYPFLVDTTVFSKHIDFDGTQYPARGEEQFFSVKIKSIKG